MGGVGVVGGVGFLGRFDFGSLGGWGGPPGVWGGGGGLRRPGRGLIEKFQNQKHPSKFSFIGRGTYRTNIAPPMW